MAYYLSFIRKLSWRLRTFSHVDELGGTTVYIVYTIRTFSHVDELGGATVYIVYTIVDSVQFTPELIKEYTLEQF